MAVICSIILAACAFGVITGLVFELLKGHPWGWVFMAVAVVAGFDVSRRRSPPAGV